MHFSYWLSSILLLYFGVLLWIARATSKDQSNESFFIGKRNSNWFVVAFGMIGTSLSGVTFISVPGTVGSQGFYYLQVVMGYFLGYLVVAFVLLPVYYRMQVSSIYHFLDEQLGRIAYKTGASFFILSRTVGATARLFLVINVLQLFLLNDLGISFYWTAFFILFMILVYTMQGGVKTIVWTDTLQTFFMLLALVSCIFIILNQLDISFSTAVIHMNEANYLRWYNGDFMAGSNFWKHLIGGAFITISMTGMDQEMMQKNISVRTLKDSQKNMLSFSVVLVIVNILFLILGGLLSLYANQNVPGVAGDDLFPSIAFGKMPVLFSLLFVVGLISALFPSADGAITALTSSFCVDILGFNRNAKLTEHQKIRKRKMVHFLFALIFLLLVFIFKWIDNKSIIDLILKVAGYTYGPLLGLYAFALFSKRGLPNSIMVFVLCCLAPVIVFVIDRNSANWFHGFSLGYLNLPLNGLVTYLSLLAISKQKT